MSNRPADILDQADAVTTVLRDAAIAGVRNAMVPQQTKNADGTWPVTECTDCDTPIPDERLAMARIRCTGCEEVHQTRERQYARR